MQVTTPAHSRSPIRRSLIWCLAIGAMSAAGPAPAAAQRLPAEQFRSGRATRSAFRQVVSRVRRSTVELVGANDEIVALGAIVEPDGWILSKASQVTGDLQCHLSDGRKLPVTVHSVHRQYDLALLKVEAENLPAVNWASSGDPLVGQWLATAGPGELPVAVGVMSVQRRSVPRSRGLLGISINDADDGPQITRVHPESGAEQAGLKVGDIITSVAGRVVDTGSALASRIRDFSPGDRLELKVTRGGEQLTVLATLTAPFGGLMSRGQVQNQMGGKLSTRRGGFPLAFQHDTVLAPEECGGPIVNLDGQVVGINIARSGRVESYAIPADVVLGLVAQMKATPLEASPESRTAPGNSTPPAADSTSPEDGPSSAERPARSSGRDPADLPAAEDLPALDGKKSLGLPPEPLQPRQQGRKSLFPR